VSNSATGRVTLEHYPVILSTERQCTFLFPVPPADLNGLCTKIAEAEETQREGTVTSAHSKSIGSFSSSPPPVLTPAMRASSAASSSSDAATSPAHPPAPKRMMSAAGGHRNIAAAWKGQESNVPSRSPISPSSLKKREHEEAKSFSPEVSPVRASSAASNVVYAQTLQQQRDAASSPLQPSTSNGDPFAAVSRGRPRSAASTARSAGGDDDSASPTRPHTSAGGRFGQREWPLPPSLAHLHFPSHSFPPYLLGIASRVFHLKMRDLGIREGPGGQSLEKERRFVWLVCRQSMGASGAGSNSAAALSAPSSPVRGGGDPNGEGLMALRIPDACLGPQALREVCLFLSRDTRFSHLQLSGNILGDDGAERLAELLQVNTNLTSLDVRATGLGQHAFATLLSALVHHPSITSLDAGSIKSEGRMFMGSIGCKALAKVLKHNSVLRKLHLSNAGLVGEGVSTVVRGLALNRTLVSLDLSSNDLTPKSIGRLGEALAFLHTLQSLVLAENRMGTVGTAVLCDTLRKMENLKRLDLRKNGIGLRGLTILTDTIGEMISLQELLLDGNAFTENSRTGILSALSASSFTTSSSSSSHTGSGGAMSPGEEFRSKDYVETVLKRLYLVEKRVSPRMCNNTALRTLSLCHSNIGDKLCEDLSKILQGHRGLQSLHLTGNALGDQSAFALAELLRHAPSLANLHASENSIGDAGGAALCLALSSPSCHLTFLSLRVNNVGKASAAAVLQALQVKRALHVDLSGNKIPWILYSKVNELSGKNKRVFEASLAERYQAEWERLQARHEYRLQVEDQCIDSVAEMEDLTETLHILEESHSTFKESESDETKALQQQLNDWNHALHEVHAVEKTAEAEATALTRELDGRVSALRKGIEKEQRFIQQAEKLIPQTIAEIERETAEMEAGLVDVRRDLRLYTTDRNVEFDGLVSLKADLLKFIRDLESQIKPKAGSNKKSRPGSGKSTASARKKSPGGKSSSKKNTTPSSGTKTPATRAPTRPPSRPTTSAGTRPPSRPTTSAGSRPPTARAPSSSTPSRPDSARKQAAGGNGAIAATIAAAEVSEEVGSPSARKQRASTAPLKKKPTSKKAKGK
jgi:Ran GTPase-activating protein (RanGAP) involved in mRNA processing and transport